MEEREREEFERILRRLQETGKVWPEEREPEELPEKDYVDRALIVPCKGQHTGHLIGWYTSGFQ